MKRNTLKKLVPFLLLILLTTGVQSYVGSGGWWESLKAFWASHLHSWGFGNKKSAKFNPASVAIGDLRYGRAQSSSELMYLFRRDKIAQQSLESLLGRSLEGKRIPRIAVLATGGGYRAMFSSIGSLVGAQKIGLLNAITYLAGVSGSCWAFGSWMCSDLPIEQFRNELVNRAAGNILNISFAQAQEIWRELKYVAQSENRKLTLVDLYGGTLGNKLLGPEWRTIHLSDQIKRVSDGMRPLPIYTAVITEKEFPAHWFTFTPYEVGDATSDWYVQSKRWGAVFNKTLCTQSVPEYTFAYLMGVFGSGFSGNFYHLYEKQLKGTIGSKVLEQLAQKIAGANIGHVALSKSSIPNIGYGIKTYPFSEHLYSHLIDSGLELNLPYPIFGNTHKKNQRTADIWIIFDISAGAHNAFELKRMVEHAKQEGWRLPSIDVNAAKGKQITVFKDDQDPTLPVIIYMPSVNSWKHTQTDTVGADQYGVYLKDFDAVDCFNDGHAKTISFSYTPEQATQLTKLSEYNMVASKKKIIETLNWVIDNK